jgi:uncharacterized protein YutE (UPF0331/DUF86 family)
MNERTKDKIDDIEKYLAELVEIVPGNLEDYKKDSKTKAACERYTEIVIEAIIDLALLVVKYRKLGYPESDLEAFEILSKSKIISSELAEKLQDAKRMRNIIAHEYGEVDDEIVFNSIKDELEKDVREFVKSTKKALK